MSAEWYYKRDSYISVGFFHKNVSNFIANATTSGSAYGLTNAAAGAYAAEARAALGSAATANAILAYIAAKYPSAIDKTTGGVIGQSSDPTVNFVITKPTNSSQTAKLWAGKWACSIRSARPALA
jgi:hypothetical protein